MVSQTNATDSRPENWSLIMFSARNDYIIDVIQKMVQAMIKAEDSIQNDEDIDGNSETELDETFENLTGFTPNESESIPIPIMTSLVQGATPENVKLISEYFRIKANFSQKKGNLRLAGLYRSLQAALI